MTKMIGAAVVAALCFAAPHGAHAELNCGPMNFAKGESGRNPVAYTTVNYDGQWSVAHHMQNGDVYYRQNQYDIHLGLSGGNTVRWEGARQSNPDFYMKGMV